MGQHPECQQRGRAGPLQVIQADQDRAGRGPLLQVGLQLADPPGGEVGRARAVPGTAAAQWLVQRREQGEERHVPAELVAAAGGQRESLAGRLPGGLAEQQRLPHPRVTVNEQDPAHTALRVPEQPPDQLPFGLAPTHGYMPGRLGRPCAHRGAPGHSCPR